MPFEIILSSGFKRDLKNLSKKYDSLEDDILQLLEELQLNPKLGVSIGKNCYKIRLKITSKSGGKSGGARVITFVKFTDEKITLIKIFDKSDEDSISDKELTQLLKAHFKNDKN